VIGFTRQMSQVHLRIVRMFSLMKKNKPKDFKRRKSIPKLLLEDI
jgi:hypothetical protein